MTRASRRTARVLDLADGVPGVQVIGDTGSTITGIQYDSRLVQQGDLFVALRGAEYDGHAFVRQAVARGAAAILVEETLSVAIPQVVVANTRRELAGIAASFYGHPSRELRVIGVTGTDGKTTTSYLIDGILRSTGRVTGMIGTVAVRIGDDVDTHAARQTTPESSEIQRFLRRMVDAGVEWATLEATSHGLDLFRMDYTEFQIAAVTNVTHEHLEHHKTIEAYRRAKGILFERTAASAGTCVVNLDDNGAREMLQFTDGATVVRYSLRGHPEADLRAIEIESRAEGSTFRIEWGGESIPVSLPLIGGFNVENALCAAGVALGAGLSLPEIALGLEHAPSVPGRMVRVDEGQPFTVIVDYAHTPAALGSALSLLRSLHPNGRLLAVSGSAGERDATKRPLQGAVSARLADVSIFTSEDPRYEDADAIIREIAAGALEAGATIGTTAHCVTDRREAIRLAVLLAEPGDCVLLAGKGHEGSIIWNGEKRPWDEEAVAHEVLTERGYGLEVAE